MSKDVGKISKPKIMQSAAGYYLGYEYWDLELEAWLPYGRESIYYKTREELELVLERDTMQRRQYP